MSQHLCFDCHLAIILPPLESRLSPNSATSNHQHYYSESETKSDESALGKVHENNA